MWFFNYIYTESLNWFQFVVDFYLEHLIILLNKIGTKTFIPQEESVENILANSLNTEPESNLDSEVAIKKEFDLDQEKLDDLLEEVLEDMTPSKTSIKTSNDLFYIYKSQLQLYYRLGFLDLNLKEKISTYPTLAGDLEMLYHADLNSSRIDLEISENRIKELVKIQGSLIEASFKSSYNLIDLIKVSKVQKDFIEIVKKEDNFATILNKFSIECASIPKKDGPNASFYAKADMARLKSINIRAGERREKDFYKICQELNQSYFQKRYARDLIREERIVYFPEEENLLLRE